MRCASLLWTPVGLHEDDADAVPASARCPGVEQLVRPLRETADETERERLRAAARGP